MQVDFNEASLIEFDLRLFQSFHVGVWLTAHSHQDLLVHLLRSRSLRALEADAYALLLLCHLHHFRVEHHGVTDLFHALRQDRDQVAVHTGKESRHHFHDGNLGSQRGIHSAELEPDIPTSHHQHGLGNVGESERGGGIENPRAILRQPGDGRRPRYPDRS